MPCIFYLSLLLICVTCVICVTWHCNVLRSINIIYINLYAQCHQYLGYHSGTHVILHLPISLLAQQNCMLLLYTFAYILGILSSSISGTCPLPTMSFGIGNSHKEHSWNPNNSQWGTARKSILEIPTILKASLFSHQTLQAWWQILEAPAVHKISVWSIIAASTSSGRYTDNYLAQCNDTAITAYRTRLIWGRRGLTSCYTASVASFSWKFPREMRKPQDQFLTLVWIVQGGQTGRISLKSDSTYLVFPLLKNEMGTSAPPRRMMQSY